MNSLYVGLDRIWRVEYRLPMSMEQCLWLKVSFAACHKVLHLGLLFLLYINDMSAAVKCKLLLYTDDSVLLASGKDLVEIEATFRSEPWMTG